jgi:hypothetical protein
MRTKVISLTIVLFSTILFAQCQTKTTKSSQQNSANENSIYKLFPTKNFWTFIKLDTRNGIMWQVHFTVSDKGGQGEIVLNRTPIVSIEKEVNGRFTLHPTENMYNFLLLDQIDGDVFQVQWSMDEKNRGVMPIK